MQLTAWFQVSICAMGALAGLMLAIAEGQLSPQILSPLLAVLGFVYTDRRGTFELTPLWANACGFLAVCLATAEFFSGGESRLLAGAHLLVYSTWIVFFQRKGVRLYWWLCALCLLQVSVGSVLMFRSGPYGLLIVTYFFVAVWTLSLFSLYQARQRLLPSSGGGADLPRAPESWRQPAGKGPAQVAWAGAGGLAGAAERLRGRSHVQGSIQFDPHERWLRLRFATGTVLWGIASLFVGAIFFLLTPRLWIGSGQPFEDPEDQPGRGTAVTGFADDVQLGEFDSVLTSAEPVFGVRLIDEQTGERLNIFDYASRLGLDEPLFRGAVLSRYVPSSRRWRRAGYERRIRVDEAPGAGMIRQEIRLQPISTDVLFAIHPVRACRVYSRRRPVVAYQDQYTGRLFASRNHDGGARYDIYSLREQTAAGDLVTGEHSRPRGYERVAASELTELATLARQVAGYFDAARHPPDAEMARRLLAFLRDSQEFQYSLATPPVDRASDPIEDFLLRRKSGHCEYFASALTLMLRAVDVPARLVNGFKGGEPGEDGELQVQRRHAHAWVEAWYGGRWHVLDPTPAAARTASVERMGAGIGAFSDLMAIVSHWWSDYVVGMNLSQQRRDLYEPLQKGLGRFWESLQGNRQNGSSLAGWIRGFLSSPRRWFSWQGGAVTFGLLLVVSGLVWLMRRAGRSLRRLWSRMRRGGVDRGRQVEFYERFRRLCERQGLVRSPGQTQREFANDVRGHFQPVLLAAGIGEFPTRLVELFYQVRFGEQPLDTTTAVELDHRLAQMERCLLERPKTQAESFLRGG